MTSPTLSQGKKFRLALATEKPLQLPGTINAYSAILAKHAGFNAIYLSGAGVANSSYGLPDLGLTTLDNVIEDVDRITTAVDLPLIVDIDTGWGSDLMIGRSIKAMIKAGAAGIHIEDQVFEKRCGHRPGKSVVGQSEMVDRIKAALDARTDADFMIIARTDAFALEGIDQTIERAAAYQDAGADAIFPDAIPTLEHYSAIKNALKIPLLANITEFGKTPLFTLQELADTGIDIALYPLSASRAMYQAALLMYHEIREKGSQKDRLGHMQTREELYKLLNYYSFEKNSPF